MTERLHLIIPPDWRPILDQAAGEDGVSALIRDALRREVKRRLKRDLPGESRGRGRPKNPDRA